MFNDAKASVFFTKIVCIFSALEEKRERRVKCLRSKELVLEIKKENVEKIDRQRERERERDTER